MARALPRARYLADVRWIDVTPEQDRARQRSAPLYRRGPLLGTNGNADRHLISRPRRFCSGRHTPKEAYLQRYTDRKLASAKIIDIAWVRLWVWASVEAQPCLPHPTCPRY